MSAPAPGRVRRPGGLVLLLAVFAIALYAFAAALVRSHLDHSGSHRLAALDAGKAPWSWRFRAPRDLIAGRVFGNARLQRTGHGLRIRSRDGTTLELGFPLETSLDLQRAARLRLDVTSTAPLHLGLRIMAHPDAPSCMARLPWRADATWTLTGLHWTGASGLPCPPPRTATLFRLRIRQPAGAAFTLRAASLLPSPGMQAPSPRNAVAIPARGPAVPQHQLEALEATPLAYWPVARLPSLAGPERQLALRDIIRTRVPGSIVLGPDGVTQGYALRLPGLSWYVLALYAATLAILEWRRRRAAAADPTTLLTDAAAAVFGLLWLIAGLHLVARTALPDLLIAGLGFLWAWRISWIALPGPWTWFGHLRDYPAPFALLVILVPLMLAFGHAPELPSPQQAGVYLGWALLQQWLMLAVLLRRLEHVVSAGVAIALCALVFALMHTPNARLMVLCLVAESWWAWCFLRRRALVPVALAHALFALALQAGFSHGWLRSLEVGGRFFMPW